MRFFKIKNKKNIFIYAISGLVFVSSFFPTVFSYAKTEDDLKSANDNLDSIKAQQSEILGDIADLNDQIDSVAGDIVKLDAAINEKNLQTKNLQNRIDEITQNLNYQYSTMALRIKYTYENNNSNLLNAFLESNSLADLFSKVEYISQMTKYDQETLSKINDLHTEQQNKKKELEDEIYTLNVIKDASSQKQNDLNDLLAKSTEKLNTTNANLADAEKLALEYEKKLEEENAAKEEQERQKELAKSNSTNTNTSGDIINLSTDNNQASKNNSSMQNNQTTDSSSSESNIQSSSSGTAVVNSSDLAMLAAIIECEAGNQSYLGKLAVGSVVMNRVHSSRFSNSVSSVIYESGQFSPVASGRFAIVLARGANESCINAASEVLSGNIVTDALFFHMYRGESASEGTIIGDHFFY